MRDMNTYNGWKNYATWRINLELIDGTSLSDIGIWYEKDSSSDSVYQVGRQLRDYVEQYIIDTTPEGVGRDYALAFVDQVDYDEIAQHMIEEA